MPVYRLSKELIFPNPELANSDGILAIGGDLSVERLLLAYSNGIFPWYSEGDPLLWWSPDPRFVLFPAEIKISKSMKKFLRKNIYTVTYDTSFSNVMSLCGSLRREGTWITDDMLRAYCRLHELGFAHSVEVWYDGELAGGLYGVALGACFFGESMFSKMENASKTALIDVTGKLARIGFQVIDCQVYTAHLESMGAVNIPRADYLEILAKCLSYKTLRGNWGDLADVECNVIM